MKKMTAVLLAAVLLTSPLHAADERPAPPTAFLSLACLTAIPAVVYYDLAMKRKEQSDLTGMDAAATSDPALSLALRKKALGFKTRQRKTMARALIFSAASLTFLTIGGVKLAIEDNRFTVRKEIHF